MKRIKSKSILALVLVIVTTLSSIPEVAAGNISTGTISGSSPLTLNDGYIYTVTGNTTINGSTGGMP